MSTRVRVDSVLENARERYLSSFPNRSESGWMRDLRKASLEKFAVQGFPSTRHEEWKYTDVRPILELGAQLCERPHLNGLASSGVAEFAIPGLHGHRLVFVNGHFAPELSDIQEMPQGVTFGSLAEHIAHDSELVQEHLNQYVVKTAPTPFVDLNTAFLQDGAFLHVPQGIEIDEPIHLLFLSKPESATESHVRNLVLIGAQARVTLVEHYASTHDAPYFTNSVTEIVVGKNARVEHTKLQMESPLAFHVASTQVQQERDVVFSSHNFDFGGRIVRNTSSAVMGGENIECTMNGLYLIAGDQHVDNHTAMDHAMPHCNSYEVYTGVLDDKARGVFNGKIFVRRDAQKTDAKQSNRNLLLSNEALVNTKPQLEIFADDVKCTHGATIGQLDEDAEFYLRARGIPKEQAHGLLVLAFASEVLEGVEDPSLRAFLENEITTRLAK
jgi:Fe-S cluster assembly protein SufD